MTMLSRSLWKEERDGITENRIKRLKRRVVGRESGEGCEEWLKRPPRDRAQPLEPAGPQPEAGLCPSGEHEIYLLSG